MEKTSAYRDPDANYCVEETQAMRRKRLDREQQAIDTAIDKIITKEPDIYAEYYFDAVTSMSEHLMTEVIIASRDRNYHRIGEIIEKNSRRFIASCLKKDHLGHDL